MIVFIVILYFLIALLLAGLFDNLNCAGISNVNPWSMFVWPITLLVIFVSWILIWISIGISMVYSVCEELIKGATARRKENQKS